MANDTIVTYDEVFDETNGLLRDGLSNKEIGVQVLRDISKSRLVYGQRGLLNNATPLTLTGNWTSARSQRDREVFSFLR